MKKDKKQRMRKKVKKIVAYITIGMIATVSSKFSYAQLNLGEKIDQWYSVEKTQTFQELDSYAQREMELQEQLFQSEAKLQVMNMENRIEAYTEEELIPQYLQNLENHYQELVSKIHISTEEEKEAFRKELELSLEKAKQEAEAKKQAKEKENKEEKENKDNREEKDSKEEKDIDKEGNNKGNKENGNKEEGNKEHTKDQKNDVEQDNKLEKEDKENKENKENKEQKNDNENKNNQENAGQETNSINENIDKQ